MKTSNRLLLATAVILIGYLVCYDLSLKAEYVKGSYKNRFYGMKRVAVTNFDAVKLNAINFTTVTIERGDEFAVWQKSDDENQLLLTKRGKTINIDYKRLNRTYFTNNLIIICPKLTNVIATAQLPERNFTDAGTININYFGQDTMNVQAGKGIAVQLMGNTINKLNVGTDNTGGSVTILPGNHITAANFNMQGEARLRLIDPAAITKATYKLSPQTQLTLSNDALKLFPH